MTSRKKPQKKRSTVPFYVGGGILVLLLVAFITTGLDGGDGDNGGSKTQEYANVSITGSPLPPYSQDSADTSIGMVMPEVSGESFDGTPISITNDGRPKVVLLLTHW